MTTLLGGLTPAEIARAFLATEPAIQQRIVRAKRTLAEARVPFELPRDADLATDAVDEAMAREEQTMIAALTRQLDEQGDTAAAAAQVRALMFVARFRQDIDRRLEQLDAH